MCPLEVNKHMRDKHYGGVFFSVLFLFSMLEAAGVCESGLDFVFGRAVVVTSSRDVHTLLAISLLCCFFW